jgi:hypothetical protein
MQRNNSSTYFDVINDSFLVHVAISYSAASPVKKAEALETFRLKVLDFQERNSRQSRGSVSSKALRFQYSDY